MLLLSTLGVILLGPGLTTAKFGTKEGRQILLAQYARTNHSGRWECLSVLEASSDAGAAAARERWSEIACKEWPPNMFMPGGRPSGADQQWCSQNGKSIAWFPSIPVARARDWVQCLYGGTNKAGRWFVFMGDSNTRMMAATLVRLLKQSPLVDVAVEGPLSQEDKWWHADLDYVVTPSHAATAIGIPLGAVARISMRFSSSIQKSNTSFADLGVMRNSDGKVWVAPTPAPLSSKNPFGLYIANSLWWVHISQSKKFMGATEDRLATILSLVDAAQRLSSHLVWALYGEYGDYRKIWPDKRGAERLHLQTVDALVEQRLRIKGTVLLNISALFNAGGDYCVHSCHWTTYVGDQLIPVSAPHLCHVIHVGGIHYSLDFMNVLLDAIHKRWCPRVME
jgi:hypothetical protein